MSDWHRAAEEGGHPSDGTGATAPGDTGSDRPDTGANEADDGTQDGATTGTMPAPGAPSSAPPSAARAAPGSGWQSSPAVTPPAATTTPADGAASDSAPSTTTAPVGAVPGGGSAVAVASPPAPSKTPGPGFSDRLLGGDVTWLAMVGGLLVALVVAVAGVAVLTRPDTAPLRPYFPLAGTNEVSQPILDVDRDILYVPVGDTINAYPSPDDSIDFCPASGNIESVDGEVWTRAGAPLNAGAPLDQYRVIVFDDTIYVDTSGTEPSAATGGGGGSVQPQCTGSEG